MLENKYNIQATEAKWQKFWQENGVYKFEKDSKKPTFSIDTPPPTISGGLHMGHILSFSQADMIARYQRMTGKNLFIRSALTTTDYLPNFWSRKKKRFALILCLVRNLPASPLNLLKNITKITET